MTAVLLIEFNELSAPLLSQFMAKGALPNFRRFYDSSSIYTTTAGEDPLEPWVQWPSVHCGVPYAKHGALHLGDGRRIRQKALGTILSECGIPVGIFGTMNSNYARPNGYHLPDPWEARDCVYPEDLLPFFDFIAHHVRESTRGTKFGLVSALGFVRFLLTHGLSLSNALAVMAQLLAERANPKLRWKRAPLLDLLQYDVFRHQNKKHAVRFASLFLNSTAHLQHYFWRNMDPRGFVEPPDAQADESLRDAVSYGYRSMDRILGRILRDYPHHRLIMCTALSQEPWFATTKCTYRPSNFPEFLRFANVSADVRIAPVMAEHFRLVCDNDGDARDTKLALDRLVCRGEPLMSSSVDGRSVYTGCNVIDAGAEIFEQTVHAGDKTERFGRLLYRITGMNSGLHHREGSLWIREGRHRIVPDHVPLESIAPTILHYFGVEPPDTMRRELVLDDAREATLA